MKANFCFAAILAFSLVGVATPVAAQPKPPEGKQWVPVPELSDEFDDDQLDKTKWVADPEGHPDFGWIGRPPGLFQEESVRLRNGMMEILVGKLDKPVTSNKYNKPMTFHYHGGIVRALAPTTFGNYYECRMKMNKTEMGGGFWIMSRNVPGKKHEIDITESVGRLTELTHSWAKDWDRIMHSNTIWRATELNPEPTRSQKAMYPEEKNSERFYRYGCWWKSPKELLFYLDGEYVYTLEPPTDFDHTMFLHISIECYDWNPIPEDGGMVASASEEDPTTYFDYVRTYKLVDADE